jgi:hypothetical protein
MSYKPKLAEKLRRVADELDEADRPHDVALALTLWDSTGNLAHEYHVNVPWTGDPVVHHLPATSVPLAGQMIVRVVPGPSPVRREP